MRDTEQRAKIIERVQKLRALGQSNNEHEASQAKQRAAAMMAQHQLLESELGGADDIEVGEWEVEGVNFVADWRLGLLTAISMRYGCRAIRVFLGNRASGYVVGPKTVAEVVKQIFAHFHGLIYQAVKVAAKERRDSIAAMAARAKIEETRDAGNGKVNEEEVYQYLDSDQHNTRLFTSSFCAGATIVLQDRILYESMNVDLDLLGAGALPSSVVADAGQGVMLKTPTNKVAALSQSYVQRLPGIDRSQGRSYSQDRHAFNLGKCAGRVMKMPANEKGSPNVERPSQAVK